MACTILCAKLNVFYALHNFISGNEARVYELVVRHFLACVSQDAQGKETTVTIDINGEKVQINLITSIIKRF